MTESRSPTDQAGNSQSELLERIRRGDEAAVAKMVRNELPRVYNLCLRLCQRQTEAEDLAQDVFVRAIRFIKDFKGDSTLATWLYRITLNTWKNQIRSNKRRQSNKHVPLEGKTPDGETTELNIAGNDPDPGSFYEKTEKIGEIMKALEKLELEEKSVLVLRDIEQKSYVEIGAILDLNVGTVKSRLSRARDHLREVCKRLRINTP